MADAKYVVGDHRNGDAKIELDANKQQFSGLTKEELMKYADDPFWVRLRWFMFILFWALWLCMLAGAIAIIVRTPKCYPPPPRTWYEKGPLVDMATEKDYSVVESKLELLKESHVAGIFASTCEDTYQVLGEDSTCIDKFKEFVAKANKYGVKVIVDLTANFVSVNHTWFQQSVNKSSEYSDYFIRVPVSEYDTETNQPKPPANWVTKDNEPSFIYNKKSNEFYLQQFGPDHADLNMGNPNVVKQFDNVIKKWMDAGAAGVRLRHAGNLVNVTGVGIRHDIPSKANTAIGTGHNQHDFWQHAPTIDQPGLDDLLAHWSHLVDTSGNPAGVNETVFTLMEEGKVPKLYLPALRPPSLAPLNVLTLGVQRVAEVLSTSLPRWPAVKLESDDAGDLELAIFSQLLPATPVLNIDQLERGNETFAQLVKKRSDASVQHGQYYVGTVAAQNTSDNLLACVRWKLGHNSYVAVYNPLQEMVRANLTMLSSVPADLEVYTVSDDVKVYTNYTQYRQVHSSDVLVPAKSSVVLSFVVKK